MDDEPADVSGAPFYDSGTRVRREDRLEIDAPRGDSRTRRPLRFGRPEPAAPGSDEPVRRAGYFDMNPEDAFRPSRRTVFTNADWSEHRSPRRYIDSLLSLPSSGTLLALAPPLIAIALETCGVLAYDEAYLEGTLPGWCPPLIKPGLEPFSVTANALALLLGFRANYSYERWRSARDAWSDLTSGARALTRGVLTYVDRRGATRPEDGSARGVAASLGLDDYDGTDDDGADGETAPYPALASASDAALAVEEAKRLDRETRDAQERIAAWTRAFAGAMCGWLREDGEVDLLAELLAAGLPPAEAAACARSAHPPLWCLQALTLLVARAPMRPGDGEAARPMLDLLIGDLERQVSLCEKILKTPMPLFYTQHVARFMSLWIALLPLGLAPSLGYDTVPAMLVIAFTILGIDEIALQIEEPFGILPLEFFVRTIASDTALLGRAATTLDAGWGDTWASEEGWQRRVDDRADAAGEVAGAGGQEALSVAGRKAAARRVSAGGGRG